MQLSNFGGGCTLRSVGREKAGIIEGDLQRLEKIVEYVFSKAAILEGALSTHTSLSH
jgi:hypothetical protein